MHPLTIGIDASNISGGGGLTHLVELLRASDPASHGFGRLVLWSSRRTLSKLEPRPWLEMRHEPVLEAGFARRAMWQRYALGAALRDARCDLLFAPGGSFATPFRPVATMSRNLLPFEMRELLRYGLSLATLKTLALRRIQSASYRRASGTIFLTRYARETVLACTGPLRGLDAVVPHGVDDAFRRAPRPQRRVEECSEVHPFRWLYVSSVEPYKHQWHVAAAVAQLRAQGLPVAIDFIGSGNPAASKRLRGALDRLDRAGHFLRWHGGVEHRALPGYYAQADAFAYASSCENLPNILLEAMASGLPIAASRRGPMPEVLGEAGDYFDPEDPVSIMTALRRQLLDDQWRARSAALAHEAAQGYSWRRCAAETFAFLRKVASTDGASP